MKDFIGKELNIGDKVGVSLSTSTRVSNIYEGEITNFVNRSGYECATIKLNKDKNSWYWHNVTRSSNKIVKL